MTLTPARTALACARMGASLLASAIAFQAAPAMAAALDARSLGLGRAQLALDVAASTAWTNAALLGLPSAQQAMMAPLPGLSLGLGNDAFGFQTLDALLSGKALSDADARQLSASIPASGLGLKLDFGSALGVSAPMHRSGFFVRASADTVGLAVPRDLLTLLLLGNSVTSAVSIDALQGARADAFADVGFSVGVPVAFSGARATALGLTARYIQGIGFARITEARGKLLETHADGSFSGEAQATYQYGTMGAGGALDLSLASEVRDDLRLVATLGNIGAVRWPKITEKHHTYRLEPYQLGFSGDDAQFSAGAPSTTTTEAPGPGNDQELWDPLPLKLGFGARWIPLRSLPLQLLGDVELGTGRAYGVSTQPEVRLGGEWRLIDWLPLRAGLSAGGERATSFTTGLGLELGACRVDLAIGSYDGLFAASKGGYYALASQFKF
ncbi:hypothetical protein J7643_11875 [bacterium]|nr:hypothetical protein [bacterium]